MNKSTKSQFNDVLRLQGSQIGILPVENIPNEEIRLEEVKRLGILNKDFSDEAKYNSLTQLATIITKSKFGLINILGSNIQQCKTNYGFNVIEKTITEEIPREISICQYSLVSPKEPLIIDDLNSDERTKNFHKMDFFEGIRFYAGSPLITSKGYSIGTLCVIDSEPKKVNHDQIEALRILADQVVGMIENEFETKNEGFEEKKDLENDDNFITTKYFSTSSILFADFVGFTKLVEKMEPGDLIQTLNTFFNGFDKLSKKHEITKVKTIGDCYMCVSGIPKQQKDHAQEICALAFDMLQFVEGINIQHQVLNKPIWKLRIGIHTGPLIAGSTSDSLDVWGDAVNIASRLENSGEEGKIHISEKTADHLGEKGVITPRGEISLKNKGIWKTFFLENLNY